MKTTADLRRLMIFIRETDRHKGRPLAKAILERLRELGCAGATVLQGMSGYGSDKQIHTTSLLDLTIALPVVILIVETPEKVAAIQPVLEEMIEEGLIIADDVSATRLSRK